MFALRLWTLVAAVSFVIGCGGGAVSVLHARGKPTGDGPAQLAIKNASGQSIEKLFVAKTEAVDQAGAAPGSGADEALWGDDQLGNAGIPEGQTWDGLHLAAEHYDILVVGHDHREQLVKHLDLKSGGRYVLEVKDDWTMGR
jgi:hypothetical protein